LEEQHLKKVSSRPSFSFNNFLILFLELDFLPLVKLEEREKKGEKKARKIFSAFFGVNCETIFCGSFFFFPFFCHIFAGESMRSDKKVDDEIGLFAHQLREGDKR
jgi:hypothetical protein